MSSTVAAIKMNALIKYDNEETSEFEEN